MILSVIWVIPAGRPGRHGYDSRRGVGKTGEGIKEVRLCRPPCFVCRVRWFRFRKTGRVESWPVLRGSSLLPGINLLRECGGIYKASVKENDYTFGAAARISASACDAYFSKLRTN